jgi:hypothetical protein
LRQGLAYRPDERACIVAPAGTPFLYFPLENRFEQNFHFSSSRALPRGHADGVRHFDARHDCRCDDCRNETVGRFKPVEAAGAARAARMLADLL